MKLKFWEKKKSKVYCNSAITFRRKWKMAHHGTSMYGLRCITAHGLMPGWNHHGEDEPSAIYLHNEKYAGLCLQYVLYVHLFGDGKYIGVLLKLAIMQASDQWMTYSGCYHVLGCYLHILDQHHLQKLYLKGQAPHINRRWQPELELHPNDEQTALFARSMRKASEALCIGMWD